MSYVIYDRESTIILGGHNKWYATRAAAKGALTRILKDSGFNRDCYGIEDVSVFKTEIEKWVVRKNLMSGKEYSESINTPIYCSPAFESYWSM
jgi:hypothetical protein